jgi:hypothetical protein
VSVDLLTGVLPRLDVAVVLGATASAYLGRHPTALRRHVGGAVLAVNPDELALTAHRFAGARPRTLSDRQLVHARRTSTLAARSRMPVGSRISLTAYRERLLDELLRRRLGPPDGETRTR